MTPNNDKTPAASEAAIDDVCDRLGALIYHEGSISCREKLAHAVKVLLRAAPAPSEPASVALWEAVRRVCAFERQAFRGSTISAYAAIEELRKAFAAAPPASEERSALEPSAATRCDLCAPEFTCFDGSAHCRKYPLHFAQPPAAPVVDSAVVGEEIEAAIVRFRSATEECERAKGGGQSESRWDRARTEYAAAYMSMVATIARAIAAAEARGRAEQAVTSPGRTFKVDHHGMSTDPMLVWDEISECAYRAGKAWCLIAATEIAELRREVAALRTPRREQPGPKGEGGAS